MRVYKLGHVPWEDSQLLYHAMARLGHEALNLLSPASPYVCVGYHQDARQEIDLEYCRQNGIPVFRREVGGGAVFLDGQQLFYQLILRRDHPLAGCDKETFYRTLLEPVVRTYADLGIPTRYKPVNDVVTLEGRKISGNGAAHIGHSVVFVGNIILDFDYETMARVLRVPDEKYRDKVFKSMQENLTTIRRERGAVPAEEDVVRILSGHFAEVLGPLEEAETVPAEVRELADQLRPQFLSDEWTFGRSRPARPDERGVKIAAGVHVLQRVYKTPGGLVRATLEVKDEVIHSAWITGDFFFYPEQKLEWLEKALQGVPMADVPAVIQAFYEQNSIESPGVTPAELAAIIQGRV
ncbi:MAG: lipoate--protein ligase [Anaerolineae bacterium]